MNNIYFLVQVSGWLLVSHLATVPWVALLLIILLLCVGMNSVIITTPRIIILLMSLFIIMGSSFYALAVGNDYFYVANEARLVFYVIYFLFIGSYKWPGVHTKSQSIILVAIFSMIAINRGFGLYMPIYFGAITFVLYPYLVKAYWPIFSIFSGSGTTSLSITAAALISRHQRLIISLILATLVIAAVVYYQLEYRGRSLVLSELDRVQLYIIAYEVFRDSSFIQIAFGRGAGYDLTDYVYINQDLNVAKWLYSTFGNRGIYVHNFHSDHLRIILSYGILFWIAFYLFLYRILKFEVFVFIFVFGVFNPIINVPAFQLAMLLNSSGLSRK